MYKPHYAKSKLIIPSENPKNKNLRHSQVSFSAGVN